MEQIELIGGNLITTENGWNYFMYHNLCFVNILDYKNEILHFIIPHLARSSDYKDTTKVINRTNREVKFIKAMILDNGSVSLSYEHKLAEGEKAGNIVPHMIASLYAVSEYMVKKFQTL